eukprot:scaffold30837_cov33-Attheya_sp.AAC.2
MKTGKCIIICSTSDGWKVQIGKPTTGFYDSDNTSPSSRCHRVTARLWKMRPKMVNPPGLHQPPGNRININPH